MSENSLWDKWAEKDDEVSSILNQCLDKLYIRFCNTFNYKWESPSAEAKFYQTMEDGMREFKEWVLDVKCGNKNEG